MKRRLVLLTAVAGVALAGCGERAATPPFAFTSATIDLPADTATLPAGPHRALVETNCLGCHSAEMLTTQPALKPAQWAATVKKMREAYKAPVAPGDDAAIVAYLGGLGKPSSAPPPR